MATQIVIGNNEFILVDDSYRIKWIDKGNAMPDLPDTLHCVIWNDLIGQNEIQNKDVSTGDMTGNVDLSTTSDAVGSTTVGDLLTWAETRKNQIETAKADHQVAVTEYSDAHVASEASDDLYAWDKTWIDYDSNYS